MTATTSKLRVSGMDCGSCAESVDRALRSLDGVADVRVDVVGGWASVDYSRDKVTRADLGRAVRRAGYRVENDSEGDESLWHRHGRMALVVIAGVLWSGSLLAEHLVDSDLIAGVLAIATIVTAGWYIVPRGARAAMTGALDMNFLMSIAAVGAVLIGEYGEGASAMFLFAIAQLLESRSMDRARGAIRGLMDLSPAEATVIRNGIEERIPADQVGIGELVVIRPGERIPVDGEILSGRSGVNQAPITGESIPVDKEPGSEVFAGTLNGEGVLEVTSTRLPADTTLARIIHSVAEAQASRSPSQTFVDRFARIYTPVVVIAALALAVVPPLTGFGTWGEWVYRSLVLLVVACPCALVISTPVTIVSALAGAARRGILIKGGLHLENAGRARVIALDKTGTLTEGRPAVVEVIALNGHTPRAMLALAASAESRSEHPLARAVLDHAAEQGIERAASTDTTAILGRGVRARVGDEIVYLGSERLFQELGVGEMPSEVLGSIQAAGSTAVLVGRSGPGDDVPAIVGVIAIADRVRQHAAEALRALHSHGIDRVVMITGDNDATARAVAGSFEGLNDYRAGLLPVEKVAAVKDLQREYGRVLFVGDGINDAPALAAADVGVAMGSAGSDIALETADIALMEDDLSKLSTTIRMARKAEGIIRANIAFALLTKAVFVVLAVGGLATLWMAVVADMGASLLVVMNGMRALRD
ncbi:MAG TPA: heavy metal translocating P-type ATPase [Longimicrobiaceae bacterium]|nr:heavy metal translocating P-type ATPase [Longimicrobiaceae bacterium]